MQSTAIAAITALGGVVLLVLGYGVARKAREHKLVDVYDDRTGRHVLTATSREWYGPDRGATQLVVLATVSLVTLLLALWVVNSIVPALR